MAWKFITGTCRCTTSTGNDSKFASHARPSPSRTPEWRRSTSPQTSFRERYAMWKFAEKRYQKTTRPLRSGD
ncbi:hypothetical protein CEE69_12085 [Rhodopirellula bahusiensis]|uniref:Uncharacterized protein n=1 Tax=Rhodopirellula bahusiensis TaxID=2014065 RepID=A0A2G1W8B2_9BACT|nr:hypothetical protein CEE69_12085 [Rhodopirellula bahusiensis]